MNIDDKVKHIISNNDFKKSKQESKSTSSINTPKRRTVIKLKNTLLHSAVSPDVRRLYYSQYKEETPSETPQTNQSKMISLPSIQQEGPTLYQILTDIFPLDNPIWEELLTENQTVEEIVNENPEYFIGMLNYLQCETDMKNIKDSKYPLGKKFFTQYSCDYSSKSSGDNTPLMSRRVYDQFKATSPFVNSQTTYTQQYFAKKFIKEYSFKPEFRPDKNLQSFLSMYKSTFFNWKPKYHGKIGPVNTHINYSLPFIAKTNYSDSFIDRKQEIPELQRPNKMGPFAKESELLVKQTSNQQFYPPFKLEPIPEEQAPKQKNFTKSLDVSEILKQSEVKSEKKIEPVPFSQKYFSIMEKLMDKKAQTRIY